MGKLRSHPEQTGRGVSDRSGSLLDLRLSSRTSCSFAGGGDVTPHCCSVPICLDVCVCLDAWIISDSFLTHGCLTCGWGEACLGYGRGVEGVGPRLSGADADVSSTEEASGSRLLATSAASPLAESLSTQHRLCAVYSFFMLRIEVHASYVKSLHP